MKIKQIKKPLINYFIILIYILIFQLFCLHGCAKITIPENYVSRQISTSTYTLASWQKISNSHDPIRIYVEGDGYAFNRFGKPTNDPTPKSTLMRKLAFEDPNPNVVYLARPCQFIKHPLCTQKSWSTGRFSKEAVTALYEASKIIINNFSNCRNTGRFSKNFPHNAASNTKSNTKQEIIFIGYSGGALLTGIAIQNFPDLNVKKWITLAGLLNHKAWTDYLNLYPLSHSLNLSSLPNIPQLHIIGENDKVILLPLMLKITQGKKIYIVPNADHSKGLEKVFSLIYNEQ